MDMTPLELIFVLLSFISFLIFLRRRRSASRKKQPPSPWKLPVIGNLHQLGTHPHRSLQSLSQRYGRLMLLHFGNVPVLVASSAEAAREIMKNQDLVFCSRPKLSIPDRLEFGSKDVAFAPYGEYWRRVRSICVLHLLSNKKVQSYRGVREEETSIMVERIRELGRSSPVVNMSEVLVGLTNDVVCRVALGRKYEGRKFKELLVEFLELLGTFSVGDYVPWLAWINKINGLDGRVERVAKQFDEFLQGVIQEHRDRKTKTGADGESVMDLVDVLLEFQRENEGSSPVEDDTIKAVIQDMFGAGTDTTATALVWTVAELVRNPRSLKKLQNEVRDIVGSNREVKEEDIDKMAYLKAVMKEGLRLHVPVPLLVVRESTQDTEMMGYDIALGTHVLINAWAISRDPSFWKHPEEFIPERFLETSVDYRGLHFEYTPFGAGRRGCPGIGFAIAGNELALAKLVHYFDLALPKGATPEDLDMSESCGISAHKKSPLLLVAISPQY